MLFRSKVWSMGKTTTIEPMVELYNMFNNSSPTNENQTVGPNLFFIIESVTARVAKFGVRFRF